MSAEVSLPRREFRMTEKCRFVDANEFLELAVSSKVVLRRDDNVGAGLRGLFNPTTGERFLIEEKHLFCRTCSRPSN